ncbi:hypothetical protein JXJ21_11395 [candidate division KSB1 bacterium]|nr:hypothetical protein [candidate division KSB1 bacterium]
MLNEKEVLLKEIHHRVKNNLQIICSLIYLQSRTIHDEDTAQLFRESENRVKSMALVHEKLYNSKDLAHIDFPQYIRSLVNHLYQSYKLASENIKIKCHIDPIVLNIYTAIQCGMIVNELLSNSLKHAFPGLKEGEVKIALYSNDSHGFKLIVILQTVINLTFF